MRTRINRRTGRPEYRAGCPVCDWRAPEWVRTAGLAHGQEAEHEEKRGCIAAARAGASAYPADKWERAES